MQEEGEERISSPVIYCTAKYLNMGSLSVFWLCNMCICMINSELITLVNSSYTELFPFLWSFAHGSNLFIHSVSELFQNNCVVLQRLFLCLSPSERAHLSSDQRHHALSTLLTLSFHECLFQNLQRPSSVPGKSGSASSVLQTAPSSAHAALL